MKSVRFTHIKKVILVALLSTLGCAAEMTPGFTKDIVEHDTVAGKIWTLSKPGATGKRILLIHGLTVDHTFWYRAEACLLTAKLYEAGYQIMFIDLPYTTDPAPYTRLKSALNGTYAADFFSRLDSVVAFGNSYWGAQSTIEIGGTSWGGLHTFMACSYLSECTHYFAVIPVPKIEALAGFESNGLSTFDPFSQVGALKNKKGYVTYGGQDTAVDSSVTTSLVNQLMPTTNYYPSYKHELTYPMINNLLDWELN